MAYDSARGAEVGVNDHIVKPFDSQEAIDKATNLAGQAEAAGQRVGLLVVLGRGPPVAGEGGDGEQDEGGQDQNHAQGFDADFDISEFRRIPNRSVDYEAGPAIARTPCRKHIAEQRHLGGGIAINDEHRAVPVLAHRVLLDARPGDGAVEEARWILQEILERVPVP